MKSINLPQNIKLLSELETENPKLLSVMKKYQSNRFIPIDYYIISQPQTHPTHQVYGVFVVDKDEVLKKLKNLSAERNQIKQDFLVYESSDGTIKYYRGLKKGEHENTVLKHMEKFVKKYGGRGKYYGSFYDAKSKRWLTTQHHYSDENDPSLPSEEFIRENIKAKLNQVHRESKMA